MHFKQFLIESTVEYGYHITYLKNLYDISKEGLIPGGKGSNYGGDGETYYDDNGDPLDAKSGEDAIAQYSRRGVFFVRSWEDYKEQLGLYQRNGKFDGRTDVPVILRFKLNKNKETEDVLSTGETMKKTRGNKWFIQTSYLFKGKIPPIGIECWTGKQWEKLPNVDISKIKRQTLLRRDFTGRQFDQISDD